MDFIRENKGKLILAAATATVGGVIWCFKNSASLADKITLSISKFEESQSCTSPSPKDTLISELRQLLQTSIASRSASSDRITAFSDFLLTSFHIFDDKVALLAPSSYSDPDLLKTHQEIISAILSVLSTELTKQATLLAPALADILLTNTVREKSDFLDFFFTSMPYILEQDAIDFLNAHIIPNKQLKHEFLSKLLIHSYSCLHITTQSIVITGDEPLSNSAFFFACYFPLISEEEFLDALNPAYYLSSIVLYNHFLTSFNKNIELFTFRETFLIEWTRLLHRVIASPKFVLRAANSTDTAIFPEIYKQLVHSVFNFMVSYNLLDKEIPEYWELYSKRMLPYSSIMILAEEALKSLDLFLLNIKRAGLNIFKYKTAFMTVLHDFTASISQFYAKTNSSNFHDTLKAAVTLTIIHFLPTRIPSSASIANFWDTTILPKDCSKQLLKAYYFKANLAPLFDITGMVKLVESSQGFYKADAQKRVKIFLQLMNNKKSIYNRLRVIGYQFAVLSSEFEDEEIQRNIIQRLFKTAGEIDTNAVMANTLNIAEKVFTPLHLINQTMLSHENGMPVEETEFIIEEVRKHTLNGLLYLQNVFALAGQNLSKSEALTYLRNGIFANLVEENLDYFLAADSTNDKIILKPRNELPRSNLLELFFDRQMCFEGFIDAHLDTDIEQPLYDSLDTVKEVQYRLFTKTFFVNYIEQSVFSNEEVNSKMLPNLLVFYELIIDFIYQSSLNGEPDLNIQVLQERLCSNPNIIQSLQSAREKFIEQNPKTEPFIDQLLTRINARLKQMSKKNL